MKLKEHVIDLIRSERNGKDRLDVIDMLLDILSILLKSEEKPYTGIRGFEYPSSSPLGDATHV